MFLPLGIWTVIGEVHCRWLTILSVAPDWGGGAQGVLMFPPLAAWPAHSTRPQGIHRTLDGEGESLMGVMIYWDKVVIHKGSLA